MVREYTLGQEQYPQKEKKVIVYDPATGQPMFKTTVPPQPQPQAPRGFFEAFTRPVLIATGQTEAVRRWDIEHPRVSDVIYRVTKERVEEKPPIVVPSPSPAPTWYFVGGVTEAFEPAPSYAPRPQNIQREVGKFVGTSLITSLTVGAAAEEAIQTRAGEWLTKRLAEKGFFGTKEKLVMKLTGARPHMAPGVLSVPSHPVMQVPEVSESVWEWGLELKQSLLFTEKAPELVTKELPAYFIRGTAMVPMAVKQIEAAYKPMPYGYAEPWKRVPTPISGGLPAPQITELTKTWTMPGLPHIPTIEPLKGASILPGLFGVLASSLKPSKAEKQRIEALTISKIREDVLTIPKVERLSKVSPSAKAVPISIPIGETDVFLKLRSAPIMKAAPVQQLKAIQKQVQSQIQKQTLYPPSMKTPTPTFRVPRFDFQMPKVSGKRRGLFGAWFKRTHPIKTPEQLMAAFYGKTRKGKRKRRIW